MMKSKSSTPEQKQTGEEMSKEQLNYYFYKEYCRLWVAQEIMKKEIEKIKKADILELEKRDKRRRRTAHEIERVYTCKYHGCQKSYGSEGSLNQHMKNKHPEFYQQYTEALNLNEGIMPKIDGSGSASYSNNKQSKTSSYFKCLLHEQQVAKMEQEELELIQRLQNTQCIQKAAYEDLEEALAKLI